MISLFRRNPEHDAAARAYECVVSQARRRGFFAECGVPDTVDGRFELICLHAFLYLHRLKDEQPEAAALGQAFFDAMFGDFDRSLREMGTGDLSVGRQVKRMAEAFYGRIHAYERGLGEGDEVLRPALRAQPVRHDRAAAGGGRGGDRLSAPRDRPPAGPADGGAACRRDRLRSAAEPAGRAGASGHEHARNSRGWCRWRGIGAEPFRQQISASESEREALARRFDLVSLDRLTPTSN